MMAISIRISGHEQWCMFIYNPGSTGPWVEINDDERAGSRKNPATTYPIALPELDHSISRIDAEGPASPGGADGVAGREALSHLQEVGILLVRFKCHAFDERPAGMLFLGICRRWSGGGEQQHKCCG